MNSLPGSRAQARANSCGVINLVSTWLSSINSVSPCTSESNLSGESEDPARQLFLQFAVEPRVRNTSMDYDSQTRPTSTGSPPTCCLTPTYLLASRNHGPSDFNQTQVMTVNWQYDIPGFKANNKLVSGVTRHWQISGVASFSDGVPLNITPTFLANTVGGGDYQRVNLTCSPNLSRSDRAVLEYFNTSCIQYPGPTLGNSGRNVIKGPGRNNFDFALFRNFNLGNEKRMLIFRAEAYNAFNHLQTNTIDTSPRYSAAGAQINATFGQALTAYPARQLQLSLRLRF
jgi:hypothetical protein